MSIKPAGLSMYSRVITTRFAGKCAFCLRPTQPGIDYAAVNASGGWIASCAGCASSLAAQVVALVRTIDATAKGQDVADILAASSMAVPAETNIVAAIDGSATEADAYDVMITLMEVRTIIENGLRPRDTLVESLRTIANDASASPRDRTFAASLVQQADKGRTLSDRQREAGVRMLARGNGSQPSVTPVENGLYITTDGKDPASIFKLYTTQNDRQGCKALIVLPNGKGTFEYIKGGTRMVAAKVADGTARKLTQDEATAFGKLHGFCVNCARDLDDERSLAVGYGPVCADNLGWYYPSVAEAAAMLNRPTTLDQVIDEADALGFLDGGE
jgi:hypothetical protein